MRSITSPAHQSPYFHYFTTLPISSLPRCLQTTKPSLISQVHPRPNTRTSMLTNLSDKLSSVPNDVRRYSNEIADYVNHQVDKAAGTLREALSSSQWIPESARPRPPPAPKPMAASSILPGSSTYAQIHSWVSRHKIWTAVIVIALGGITHHVVRRNTKQRKRRAKRAGNGARLEVLDLGCEDGTVRTNICIGRRYCWVAIGTTHSINFTGSRTERLHCIYRLQHDRGGSHGSE